MNRRARNKNLAEKLIGFSSIVITISMMAIAIVFAFYSLNQARSNLTNDLNVLSQVIGSRSAAALVFMDKKSAESNLNSVSFNEHVFKACLYDVQGKLFAEFSQKGENTQNEIQETCESVTRQTKSTIVSKGKRYLAVSSDIKNAGDTLGYISIFASTTHIEQTLRDSIITGILALLIILPVALLLLNRSIRGILSPLMELHNTALNVAKNPFSPLRATHKKNDEVGRLVNVFNEMLDTLDIDNQALLSSEQRFRSLAEHSPVGIYQIYGSSSQFIYANGKWKELTGLESGIHVPDFCEHLSDKDHSLYLSILEKVAETRIAQVIEYQYKQPGTGRIHFFLEHVAPLISETETGKKVTGFIGSLLDISELKDAQLELENLAFYDVLTNLPNRRFFMDHLKYLLGSGDKENNRVAILILDLDDFKKINDTLGHDAGDQLLIIIAERLKNTVSKHDVVSRMGGDEFLVLLTDLDSYSSIQEIADRILRTIELPVNIMGQDVEVTASIGVSTFPDDAETPEGLIRNADLALYLSKDNGRNRLSFFSKQLETKIHERVRMERKIKSALKSEAFTFYVQPQWSLTTKRLISCEVLIRWFDETEGTIGPNIFIPVAENAGLIMEIGDWLIKEVIESMARHRDQLQELGIHYLAINLSAKQFFNDSLAQHIRHHLEENNLPANMIELELTESAVMEDSDLAIEIMEKLKNLGCRLSIDDFGTGYSSLSYLKKFPIDAVKIDQSFISDIPHDQNDVEISAAVIAMGHSLGLEVVAEGVETQAQLDFLVDHKCDYAQGYFIAKPMPLDELFIQVPLINKLMEELDLSQLNNT